MVYLGVQTPKSKRQWIYFNNLKKKNIITLMTIFQLCWEATVSFAEPWEDSLEG